MVSPDHAHLVAATKALKDAEGSVRVLRTVDWSKKVADDFFARGARELPVVEYAPLDAGPILETIATIRTTLDPGAPGDQWVLRQAKAIELGAKMLAGVGTMDFFHYGKELYGEPKATILDGSTTSLALAERLDSVLAPLDVADLGVLPTPISAEVLALRMRRLVRIHLGDATPEIELVDELSAKAVAGPRRVRVRRDATFTDQDLRQLVQHEVFVHVATSLNGKRQTELPLFAAGHPGTTRTQEGLAVFSEIIGGAMDPTRFRRLADRVLAIQQCIDGADFLDLYRHFLDRRSEPQQAFEDARRIVRGGLVTGGAPFTKDGVYLDGLLRVHNFLRTAILRGRVDVVPLLFVGKLDIEDVPDIAHFLEVGLCEWPRYLPPWAKDRQFLASYLAYSGFLNGVRLDEVQRHYSSMLDDTREVRMPVASAVLQSDSGPLTTD